MWKPALCLAFVAAGPVVAQETPYDRDLALGAGSAYIASYLRNHPQADRPPLDWAKASVEYAPSKHENYDGYVGVFVPAARGNGGGVAFFDVPRHSGDRAMIYVWGYTSDLEADRARFRLDAKAGTRPSPKILE